MKNLTVALLLFFIVSQLNAQIFWEIKPKNAKNTSYLLGVHSNVPAVAFDTMKVVYKAYNRSNVIISQYENYRVDSESALKKEVILPDNLTLKDYYSDSVYNYLDKELKSNLKLGLKELGRMHPYIIRQMYMSELFAGAIGIKDDLQTDSYFQIAASETAKRIIGLQSSQDYIKRYLDKRDIKYHTDKLLSDVKNGNEYKSAFKLFYKAYCSGDLANMEYLFSKYPFLKSETATGGGVLIIPEKLISLLHKNKCFFLVDVADLIGNNSVVDQLKKAGFEVKPVHIIK